MMIGNMSKIIESLLVSGFTDAIFAEIVVSAVTVNAGVFVSGINISQFCNGRF